MAHQKIWTAAEMEHLRPDERARIVSEAASASLDDLDPEFRARVDAKSRRIAGERGLVVDTEPS